MKLPVRALAAAALALLPLRLVAQDGPRPNTYDRAGRPLTAVDQQGRPYFYTYDPDGTQNRWFGKRLVSVKRPDGTLLEFGYNEHDERGQTRVTRPGKPPEVATYPPQPLDAGEVTYDELGRLASHTDEKGHRVRFTYEKDGSRSTWREDRLVRLDEIDGTLIELAYGPRGDRGETRITKPGQPPQVVRYPPQPADESRGKTYDRLGRWSGGTVDGQAVRYTYDRDGARNTWVGDRVVQILTIDGTSIEHTYSADGFLGQTRITRPSEPPEVTDHLRPSVVPAAASAPLNLSEEPPGSRIILLVTRRTYDDFDRLETETTTLPDGTGERTVSYTYYRNGVRKTVTDPHGNVTFYTYDAQNRVRTVTTRYGTASAKTTTFGYWPDGLLKEVEYPNGVVASYGYDLADRLLTLTHAKGGEVISSYEYTYDANGNRLSQTESNGGVTEVTTYTYDALNRLKSVTYPADTVYSQGRRVEYGYDAVGNRTSERTVDPVSGEVLASKTGTFDAANRLQVLTNDLAPEDTATFTWDPNGNQTGKTQRGVTTTSAYDLQDRLVEVQQGTAVLGRFLYDFAGRRTEKIGAEGVRQYVYDQTSLLAEYSDTGLQVAKYDYGAHRLISLERGGQRRYYLFDALRSVTNITDESGLTQASYHLDAWGNFRFPGELDSSDSAASRNRFAFTGYLWDQETSLYYAKARFYDPEVGRFTSQDSFLGEINDPPSLHRYFYGNANPLRYIDPTGHAVIKATGTTQRIDVAEDARGNPVVGAKTYVTAEEEVVVHSDPIKQLEQDVRDGNTTPGQAVTAAMDGLGEPIHEATAIFSGPYIAAGVIIAAPVVAPTAAFTVPETLTVVGTGALAGGTSSGATTYMRGRSRNLSHRDSAKAGLKAIPRGAVAGGAGAYAGFATAGLGAAPSAFAAGGTADLAGQGVEMATGERDQIDLAQAALSGVAGSLTTRMQPTTSTQTSLGTIRPPLPTVQAGGGARIDYLPPHLRAQIQRFADKRGVEVIVVGSRVDAVPEGGTRRFSDFDYLVGGNTKIRQHAQRELPRGDTGGAYNTGIDVINVNKHPLDPERPHVIFRPRKPEGQ